MKIQFFSDVFISSYPSFREMGLVMKTIKKKAPILILGGNIGNTNHLSYPIFLSKMSSLQFEKIFIIHGNYEYYGNKIEIANEKTKSICQQYPNLVFLNNSYYDYEGYRFIGSTFWTQIKNTDFVWNPDYQNIHDFSVSRQNHLHHLSRHYIQKINRESPHPTIILSYHIPSYSLQDKYQDKDYSQCFYSESEDCISFPVHSWFHGYRRSEMLRPRIRGIPFFSNPVNNVKFHYTSSSFFPFHQVVEFPPIGSTRIDPYSSK